MSKGGGKGRVSNELVAASCAAVLTVYAAGYWRTRDAARRLETQAQDRRTARPELPVAAEAPVPATPPITEPPPATAAPAPVEPAPASASISAPEKPPSSVPAAQDAKPAKQALARKAAPAPPAAVPEAKAVTAPVVMSVPLETTSEPYAKPPASLESLPPPAQKWRDGTYTGWGQSNHGDIEARVVIENGRIVDSGVATCGTRYPCDVIYTIIYQPVWNQNPDVDRVSRATESADAYYYGLVEALKQALDDTPADQATTSPVIRTEALMGTVVSIEVDAPAAVVEHAFEWFRRVEAHCSRFDETSELRQLMPGKPVVASPILFEAVRFALQVAEETGGAFDPTLGSRMAMRGFDRHYVTGEASAAPGSDGATFRDVEIDAHHRTILLRRPLTLDLGAVAKGLAVDAAARELQPFRDFVIDAGGDIYFGGCSPLGKPWRAGIRHPRRRDELVHRLCVSDRAVCTSGDYERGAHILDPRDGTAAQGVASATVVAPGAMLADALATAAFVLGPERGIALLERMGVDGLIVTPALDQYRTQGLAHA